MATWKKVEENKYRLIAEDRVDGKFIRKCKNVMIEEANATKLGKLALEFELECFPDKLERRRMEGTE